MAKLTGKTALVTGGGSGIGAASAKALFDEGANVAIAGRDQKKLDQVAKQLAGIPLTPNPSPPSTAERGE